MIRTKIVCTLGPASDDESVLRDMIRAGMSVARINFSHGAQADHARRIALVRRLAKEEGRQVAVMGDLQGPKFRIGDLPAGGVMLADGSRFTLSASQPFSAQPDGVPIVVPMPHLDFIDHMQAGQRLLVDDGALILCIVESADGGSVQCEVVSGGQLTSRKGVSAPGARLAMSAITPKDRADAAFAVAQGVDALALSFVRCASDVLELRELLRGLGGAPHIVAKIEKPEALEDLPRILHAVDAIMVARGDLGVEAPAEDVPFYQKTIIRSCLQSGVPVITATQMLQSMIELPAPTRAEASDVANAVLDGTDAVMLSGETAVGKYPVEAVQAMARIAERAENEKWSMIASLLFEASLNPDTPLSDAQHSDAPKPDAVTGAITSAAVDIAKRVNAKVIVCATTTGYTARMMARHRPDMPIVALTPNPQTYQFTAFMWDVRGVLVPEMTSMDDLIVSAVSFLSANSYTQPGDRIVVTAGVPLGMTTGTTNVIRVHEIT